MRKADTLRVLTPLTNDFVETPILRCVSCDRIDLDIEYEQGSSSELELAIEFSTNCYQWYLMQTYSAGVGIVDYLDACHRFSTGGFKAIGFDVNQMYMRLKVRAIGDITDAKCGVIAIRGGRARV